MMEPKKIDEAEAAKTMFFMKKLSKITNDKTLSSDEFYEKMKKLEKEIEDSAEGSVVDGKLIDGKLI